MSASVDKVAAFVAHINLRDASAIENRLDRVGFSRFLSKQVSLEDGAFRSKRGGTLAFARCRGVLVNLAAKQSLNVVKFDAREHI